MGQRLDLHDVFIDILGSSHVYFQPPESIRLEYPCVIYKRDRLLARHANNKKYANLIRYQVIVVDPDPDGQLQYDIFNLPLCSHVRKYAADGLNHDIFELYF